MKDDYVTFEQAKALKELGFPQNEYHPQYKENGEIENGFTDLGLGCITCPTLSLVQKWLRDEKNLHIDIQTIYLGIAGYTYDFIITQNENDYYDDSKSFDTYEKALSSGIDKCIEILKNEKVSS